MSILIEGIDLPKEGEHILALIKNDGKCSYFEETALTRIMKTTEAIQIPKGHGRLIDGDKIVKEYYKKPTYLHLCTILNDAPTILEAEE